MPKKIKIKKKILQQAWFFIVRLLNRFFVFISLRESRKFWGVVYDSVSKQPLDPVIVKLSYAKTGEPVQTCVTDLAGRYGFLVKPGRFKIFAKKSNYQFPSKIIKGDNDGIFRDVYKGQFFELISESEVIAPNIPMDPVNFDWNQQAKLKILNTYPFLQLLFRKITIVFFWFLFVWALIFALNDFFVKYQFSISGWPQIVLLVYIFLMISNASLPELRLWGVLKQGKTGGAVSGAMLELTNPALSGIVLAKTETQNDGRFLLRGNPGKYILKVNFNGVFSELSVVIHKEGVVNDDLMMWISG